MSFWWKKRGGGFGGGGASRSSTSKGGSSGEGGGSGSNNSSNKFKNFFNGLQRDPKVIRFFKRGADNAAYYSVHAENASYLAKECYKTTSVISNAHGLPSLNVSVRLFSSIVPALLAQQNRIEIWEQLSDGSWKLCRKASPGNTESLLKEDVLTDREGRDALQEVSAGAVMMAVVSRGAGLGSTRGNNTGGRIGIAFVNTTFRTLGVLELEATCGMKDLESVVVQVAAKECLVEDGAAEVLAAVEACDVLVTPKSKSEFKASAEDSIADVTKLLVNHHTGSIAARKLNTRAGVEVEDEVEDEDDGNDEADMVSSPAMAALTDMPAALSALMGLVRHLHLLDDEDDQESYTLRLESLEGSMTYDNTVAQALNIFPCPQKTLRLAAVLAAEEAGGSISTSSSSSGATSSDISLYGLLNQTCTQMGARLLRAWLQHPLLDLAKLEARQHVVEFFFASATLRSFLREGKTGLRGTPDIGRTLQRFMRRPLKPSLSAMLEVYRAVMKMATVTETLGKELQTDEEGDGDDDDDDDGSGGGGGGDGHGAAIVREIIFRPLQTAVMEMEKFCALVEEVVDIDALRTSKGRRLSVRPSFHSELARLKEAMDDVDEDMKKHRKKMADALGLETDKLKLEYSSTYGYHFRLTKKDQAKLSAPKVKGQTTTLSVQKAGVMFTTELFRKLALRKKTLSDKNETAQWTIVSQAFTVAATYTKVISDAVAVVAELDVYMSLAVCAAENDWCRPKLLPMGSQQMTITGLRHPCVEAAIGRSNFIANDVSITSKSRLMVVTGPNCGGKSTFCRSLALTALCAQVGSFVPAETATLTVVDKILARVGASDNQLKGISTFMAEMLDVRDILSSTTPSSLILIDELGRGTSSEDGFGIAWAVACRLAPSGAMCLFATHFHELIALEHEPNMNAQNVHVSAHASDGKLTMLFKVMPGGCDQSFGINAAKIAGFPAHVVAEAQDIATKLETSTTTVNRLKESSLANGVHDEALRNEKRKRVEDGQHDDQNGDGGDENDDSGGDGHNVDDDDDDGAIEGEGGDGSGGAGGGGDGNNGGGGGDSGGGDGGEGNDQAGKKRRLEEGESEEQNTSVQLPPPPPPPPLSAAFVQSFLSLPLQTISDVAVVEDTLHLYKESTNIHDW